jgi:uncharacterized membrane protein
MVETRKDEKTGLMTIVLRPNNSSNWQFNMMIVLSLAFIGLVISTYFALQGLWMIFPFAGLEVGFLFICLYLRMRANINTEVITFDEHSLLVERGYYHAEQSWKYHRVWAKIFVKTPEIRGFPKQIFIRSHGKEQEIGSFLNKRDKEKLISALKSAVYGIPLAA